MTSSGHVGGASEESGRGECGEEEGDGNSTCVQQRDPYTAP